MTWRSKKTLERPRWSKVRALYKGMGYSDFDLNRPIIGLANTWSTLVPGHYNLRQVAEYVRQGVYQAGGTPVEFGVIGGCDGLANGHDGMRFILPSRELIANSVEMMVEAHRLDAVVLLGSCDKIVPGLMMAAARLSLPAIIIVGGPAEGGCEFDGRPSDTTSLAEGMGMLKAGTLSEEEFISLEDRVMPTCGSCSFLGTANSMCCAAEGLGMSLPGTATIPAPWADRLRAAQATGRRIVEMVHEGLTSDKIINEKSVENAIRLMMALGGSTNSALHLPAVAYEAGVEMNMDIFDHISRTTPHVAKMNPAAPANVPDFHGVGGVPAVMKELLPILNGGALTVTGKTLAENVAGAPAPDGNIIRPMNDPWNKEGGLAVIKGNLAPNTAVTKPAAIKPEMRKFTGPAKCFDSEQEASDAILEGKITGGEVVVIRYEGPKGGPGMREMAMPMKYLYGRGLALKTALVTDGRFSGTNNGCFVGHVSPEAAEGGPIAVVQDGDVITVDIPGREVNVHLAEEEIAGRLKSWTPPPPKVKKGYLALYARMAESADKGAVIRHRLED